LVAFEAVAGSDSAEGNIDDWLPLTRVVAAEGNMDVEGYSDYELIE
jgi:hypothetical protein